MSRYRGPRVRILRRLMRNEQLRGLTRKRVRRRQKEAGEHGKPRLKPQITSKRKRTLKPRIRRKVNKYQIRLKEKQKLRFYYGVTESQLVNYVRDAKRSKGSTGETLLKLLEMRLDNVVHRLSLGPTIPAARQLINHGHVFINSQRVTIPSYQCQPNDTISITQKEKVRKQIYKVLRSSFRHSPHLLLNRRRLVGNVKGVVFRKQVGLKLKELLVVEHYSRKM